MTTNDRKLENEDPGLDRSTELNYDRTRLSYDRTLLSWVRTGTSLITFGFAVYNFRRVINVNADDSREFGFVLVAVGFTALLLAALEYRRAIRVLFAQCPGLPRSRLPITVALLISVLGILSLFVILARR